MKENKEIKKKEFRLPTKELTHTHSQIRYSRAWRKLAKPICNLFKDESKYGYGFDPGLLIGRFSLNNSQAIKIYELITKKEFVC